MNEVQQELEQADWTIVFLVLLVFGVLLSLTATVKERDGLVKAICCGGRDDAGVFPLRWAASALVLGGTGFFAWLACRSAKEALASGTCGSIRSARTNLLAALMVFGAAVLRLGELKKSDGGTASE